MTCFKSCCLGFWLLMTYMYVFNFDSSKLLAVDKRPKSCEEEVEKDWSDAIKAWD